MSPKIIRSVTEMIDSIHHFAMPRGTHIFRGHADADCNWKLLPHLYRHYPKSKYHERKAILYEVSLCGQLMCEKMPYLNTFDPIELLMVLQHFKIPTRLLDWTSDILVALFFACYDPKNANENKNGRVLILEKGAYPYYKFNCPKTEVLKNGVNQDNLEYFQSRTQITEVSIIEPHVKNPRMRVQDGCFLFFPFRKLVEDEVDYFDLVEFNRVKDNYNKEQKIRDEPIFLANKDVDFRFKKSILEELDYKHGISEKTLFVELEYLEKARNYYQNLANLAEKKSEELLSKGY
jgi:hypothetical protein